MARTLFQRPGIRLCGSGSWPPAAQPDDSSATPTTSSPFPSPPITVRLSQALVTEQSSCGTHSATANTPLPIRVTPSGFPACDSAPTHRTPSSCPLAGTSTSRYADHTKLVPTAFSPETMLHVFKRYLLLQSLRAMRPYNTIA